MLCVQKELMAGLIRLNFRLILILCCLAGVALRLSLVIQSGWRIDYDEGMVALLGLRAMRGEFAVFVPAQASLGAIEAYLLAPLFAVFGASVVVFRLYSLLSAATYILTTGLLARRVFDERAGMIAALLAAFAPPYLLITGLKTWGATAETIILGNLLLLFTIDAIEAGVHGWKHLTLVGFIAGVMFWAAWLGFYYFVPVVFVLLWRGRDVLRVGWWAALVAFFVGSFPFWLYNFQNQFPTFQIIFNAQGADAPLTDVLSHFVSDLLPRLVTASPSWGVLPKSANLVLFILYYAGVVSIVVQAFSRRKAISTAQLLLVGFVVLLPLIYLFSGYGDSAFNPWNVDATGRYVLMLHTALPFGLASLAAGISRLRFRGAKLLAASLISMIVGLNLLGALRLDLVEAFDSPYYNRQPETLQPLIDYLDQHQIRHVWIDAGIGQVLMFVTNERIIAADPYDAYLAGGLLRFPDALAQVASAPKTAFVVPILPYQEDMPIRRALDAADIEYSFDYITPTLMIYIPNEAIDPMRIAAGLGYQY
jgi:4-amino-4-deoxy-L-arabinose transferase-like glycosyltransferase